MSSLIPIRRLDLRDFTSARVSLPTTGHSIATSEVLNFQLAHAQARDAVHAVLHIPSFAQRLQTELPLLAEATIPVLQLRSNAPDRITYLREPILGRTLHPDSVAQLQPAPSDLAIIIADGLSALAVERNAIPLLVNLLPRLLGTGWTIAPLSVVQQGRVAIGDPIGFRSRREPQPCAYWRTPGPIFARQSWSLSDVASSSGSHRRRPQLFIQHSRWRALSRIRREPTPLVSRSCSQRGRSPALLLRREQSNLMQLEHLPKTRRDHLFLRFRTYAL